MIKHYGMLYEEQRIIKQNFYKSEDTEQCQRSYKHMTPQVQPLLRPISEITYNELDNLYNKIANKE